MLADLPFSSIELSHISELLERQVRESRRLDFKRDLHLEDREGRVELLRDITAMANADGGVIVYGIEEGSEGDTGVAAELVGLTGDAGKLSDTIDSMLRNNVEERLVVQHRPIQIDSMRFVYLVHVPASPLAPHMLSGIKTTLPRFFVRANASNEPMTVRQIKEAAMRYSDAVTRAADFVQGRMIRLRAKLKHMDFRRRSLITDHDVGMAAFHLIPLYPDSEGWDYADPMRANRLASVTPFGGFECEGELSYTQDGAFQDLGDFGHVGFLRKGALEFCEFGVVKLRNMTQRRYVVAADLEEAMDVALRQAQKLTEDGYLSTPVFVQLHLVGVEGATIYAANQTRYDQRRSITEEEVASEGYVITEWSELQRVHRKMADHLWQAWGLPRSLNFNVDGTRRRFNSSGGRERPE